MSARALEAALANACSTGLLVASASGSVEFVHAPFALGPTEVRPASLPAAVFVCLFVSEWVGRGTGSLQIPSRLFEQAVALAKPYNVLYDRVSRDTAWLLHALEK
jgi:hypothetical protein